MRCHRVRQDNGVYFAVFDAEENTSVLVVGVKKTSIGAANGQITKSGVDDPRRVRFVFLGGGGGGNHTATCAARKAITVCDVGKCFNVTRARAFRASNGAGHFFVSPVCGRHQHGNVIIHYFWSLQALK